MAADHIVILKSADDTQNLGRAIAPILNPGDFIALTGPLGCGKTVFARGLIRAMSNNAELEVPSPSFTLVQTYENARIPTTHFDFYRIERPEEIWELGLDDALNEGIVIVEWPEKANDQIPNNYLEIIFSEETGESRKLKLVGHGAWQARLERWQKINDFLANARWDTPKRQFLQGDASSRRYEKIRHDEAHAILMDSPNYPDGPVIKDNKSYSEIAYLAESIEPFIAIANGLHNLGLSAPEIFAHDLDQGFLLLEDLGDDLYGKMIAANAPMDEPYKQAVEVLITLANEKTPATLPVAETKTYKIPEFDLDSFQIEAELLLDWFWPAVKGNMPSARIRSDFSTLWKDLFAVLEMQPNHLALRDYHSPNLLWLKDRTGIARVGIIDFQDAVLAPAGYDLVSLLQDARLDVAPSRERQMLDYFIGHMTDSNNFERAYAIWGAQRNTKILGIFARLAKRDGKFTYIEHMPRVSDYLERNLTHPALGDLKAWFDSHLPPATRIGLTKTNMQGGSRT